MFSRGGSTDRFNTPRSSDSQSENNNYKPAAAALLSEKHARAHLRKRNVIIVVALGCLGLLALALGLGLGLGLPSSKSRPSHSGPNVLVVMTDDQDLNLGSMAYMPKVNSLIGGEGVTYDKHFCTVAICCPSRVNFFTGRAAHNTNVTSIQPPYGGWQKFSEVGLNDDYLPVWINDAGVDTYYIGKFLNGYGRGNMHSPAPPKAWTNSTMLLDPFTYAYYNSKWTNGYTDDIESYKGQHTTDVTQAKGLAMLETAAKSGNQFFMMVAPVAPHAESGNNPPPVPERYQGHFAGVKAPRNLNFNPDEPSGASWVSHLPKLSDKQVEFGDKVHRHRLGNIAAIDDMVGEFIQKLDDLGILDNTYVIYTTDNGYHIGNHRLVPGKRCPYEEDINIPLVIRGPDVAKGVNSSIVNSHTDMAPTILQMLGINQRANFDGEPITYTEQSMSTSTKSELVNVEFWTSNGSPAGLGGGAYYNNTYKALRLLSGNESLYYSTWCTGEREFYDMITDQYQMNNRLGPNPKDGPNVPTEYFGRPWDQLIERLDALLMVTKSCKEDSCREPWNVLFPSGQVTDLESAMSSEYDAFFKNQPQISFSSCGLGYFPEQEGPQSVTAFSR